MKYRFFCLFFSLLLFLCALHLAKNERSPFSSLSLQFFQELFQHESIREAFDLDEEEAIAVFGDGEGSVAL